MAEPPIPQTTSPSGSAGGIAGNVPKNAPASPGARVLVALAQLPRQTGDLGEHAGLVYLLRPRRAEVDYVAHVSPRGSRRARGRASPP